MKTEKDVSKLIEYFADRINQVESRSIDSNAGDEPYFPAAVVFLGNNSIDASEYIIKRLQRLWPQYSDELCFVGIPNAVNDVEYCTLKYTSDGIEQCTINSSNIGGQLLTRYSVDYHFRSRTNILVYFVLDTASFDPSHGFDEWSKVISNFFADLDIPEDEIKSILILLLDERFVSSRKVASGIKNSLAERLPERIDSVFIISNRRKDNALVSNWLECYKAISSLVAISNSSNSSVAGPVFGKKVLTIGYCSEEKPTSTIGQVVVKQLVEYLSTQNLGEYGDVMRDESIKGRMGLTDKGIINIIDEYVEKEFESWVPTEEQLGLFPRCVEEYYDSISSMTETEFNSLTMSGWMCYLRMVIERIADELDRDSSQRDLWKKQYDNQLMSIFSVNELIWMKEHPEKIVEAFSSVNTPFTDNSVLDAAKDRIKLMLSTDERIVKLFSDTIAECGENASRFLDAWKEISNSVVALHTVRDENIANYYSGIVQNYFDKKGVQVASKFKQLYTVEQLYAFLKDTINDLIDSDSIFTARFEDELDARFKECNSRENADEYIRKKLTDESAPVYFRASFSLGHPIISSVLLKTGTALHETLKASLRDSAFFYNTGSGRAAEAIYIYEITNDNLVNSEA